MIAEFEQATRPVTHSSEGPGHFEESMLAGLPDSAKRYFRHAIPEGTPLHRAVSMQQEGSFLLGSNWRPFRASEILTPPFGFRWEARVGGPLFWISGKDSLACQDASSCFRLWGLIPVVEEAGPDIVESARARMIAELVWLPTALLPHFGAGWSEPRPGKPVVTFRFGRENYSLCLELAENGALRGAVIDRWGDPRGVGDWAYHPFGGTAEGEMTVEGISIPASMKIGWGYHTCHFRAFIESRVVKASFHD